MKNIQCEIFIPCFNRREKTVKTVREIKSQLTRQGITHRIHILDDGSTDGTSATILREFRNINVHRLSGKHYWGGALNYVIDFCKNVTYPENPNAIVLIANDDLCLKKSSAIYKGLELVDKDKCPIVAPVVIELEENQELSEALEKDRVQRDPALINYGHRFDPSKNYFIPRNTPGESNLCVTVATWIHVKCFSNLGMIPKGIPHYGSDYWFSFSLSELGHKIKTDSSYVISRDKVDTRPSLGSKANLMSYWSSCCNPRSPDYLPYSITFLRAYSKSPNRKLLLASLGIKFIIFSALFGRKYNNVALLQR